MTERTLHLDEPLVRVVAIGLEGLARSRPQRPLADDRGASDAGYMNVEVVYRPYDDDGERLAFLSFARWAEQLFWVRWASRAREWSNQDRLPTTQAEVERTVSRLFTYPYRIEHVSTKSVRLARGIIADAERGA